MATFGLQKWTRNVDIKLFKAVNLSRQTAYAIIILFVCVADKGDAQTAAAVPQCSLCILFWKPAGPGSNAEAVQHQGEVTQLNHSIMARTIVTLYLLISVWNVV